MLHSLPKLLAAIYNRPVEECAVQFHEPQSTPLSGTSARPAPPSPVGAMGDEILSAVRTLGEHMKTVASKPSPPMPTSDIDAQLLDGLGSLQAAVATMTSALSDRSSVDATERHLLDCAAAAKPTYCETTLLNKTLGTGAARYTIDTYRGRVIDGDRLSPSTSWENEVTPEGVRLTDLLLQTPDPNRLPDWFSDVPMRARSLALITAVVHRLSHLFPPDLTDCPSKGRAIRHISTERLLFLLSSQDDDVARDRLRKYSASSVRHNECHSANDPILLWSYLCNTTDHFDFINGMCTDQQMDNIAHAWMHRHLRDPEEACQAFTELHEASKYDLIRESCGMITLCNMADIDIRYQPLEIKEHVPSPRRVELASKNDDTSADKEGDDDDSEDRGDDGNSGDSDGNTVSSHSSGSGTDDHPRQQLDFDEDDDAAGDEGAMASSTSSPVHRRPSETTARPPPPPPPLPHHPARPVPHPPPATPPTPTRPAGAARAAAGPGRL